MNLPGDAAVPMPVDRREAFAAAQALEPASAAAPRSTALRRWGDRVAGRWLPQLEWSVRRTGRPGLVGIALLLAVGVFFFSTYLTTTREVQSLQQQLSLASQQRLPQHPAVQLDTAGAVVRGLPERNAVPELLGQLLAQADAAQVTLDTGKYEVATTKAGAVARYSMSFPITGTYPQVRAFIDNVLKAMPAVAITELSIERKHIGDSAVEAQLRLTLFTRGAS